MNSQLTRTNISPFKEMAKILREDFPYYAGWKFIEKKGGIIHYCAVGYLEKKKGYSDWRIRLNMIDNILEKYGFSHNESIKERLCPVEGCQKTGPLISLIEHMNANHKLSASEIANTIERIEHDNRRLPPWWKRVVAQLTFN
ncbi:MAG: hypothetical protein AB1608_11225 [Thermoproteota archaeon]